MPRKDRQKEISAGLSLYFILRKNEMHLFCLIRGPYIAGIEAIRGNTALQTQKGVSAYL